MVTDCLALGQKTFRGKRQSSAQFELSGHFSTMYIKFCRSLFVDKKDEGSGNLSKLSVELEEDKEKPGEGNSRLYRSACLVLGLLCLALLLLVIVLFVKLHTGSTVCPEQGQTAPADKKRTPFGPVCSYDQCQAYFNRGELQQCECYCAPGWKGYGRSCFFFSTFRLSWDESLQNCTSRGGSLAIVNSPEVQNFLARAGSLTYWIGLRELNSGWTWVNRTVLRESHWAEAPLTGDCVALMGRNPPDKNWIKASCQASTYFICQQNF
ncbi:natural killer cells antigen CD94 isoform X1 [Salarias fasciatus]|uniref:Natural killer cells antigen CD94-like n=1 Tax=Salarias fasciatus TaxID=181472 RepID=A0A672FTX4_SALFA|nr:natural killer cells antigen CD94-like isoform X1 [Salarias fasciatus]